MLRMPLNYRAEAGFRQCFKALHVCAYAVLLECVDNIIDRRCATPSQNRVANESPHNKSLQYISFFLSRYFSPRPHKRVDAVHRIPLNAQSLISQQKTRLLKPTFPLEHTLFVSMLEKYDCKVLDPQWQSSKCA